jgi:uncharacterized protein YecT (DUF1311 family)
MEQLAGLNNDYQILTELYRSGETRTFLARHLTLNRDVTVTVARASGDRSFLEAFANDAEVLKNERNPNIVPVLEGRWLDTNTFAVIRARVRGSTLDQLVSAVGAMPAPKISAALREITTALLFARTAGVTNRFVSPDSLVFQQGTGRPLISFEPSRLVTDDAQTIRELATRMNGGAPFDVTEFVAMLSGAPAVATPSATAPAATPPVPRDDTVVITQRRSGMGFGARVLTTFAILAAIIIAAVFFVKNRQNNQPERSASTTIDTSLPNATDAAGDIALRSAQPDTMVYPTPTIVEPPQPTQQPIPQPVPQPIPQQQMPAPTPAPVQQVPLPSTQPPATVTPAPRQPQVPLDTVVRAPTGDICDSPTESDQHQCLMNAIERSDRDLNATYQRLINALRRQAGVADADPDPPAVEELRSAQRRWLNDRDDACRATGSGPLYARDRAACFADRSAQRTRDLQGQLDAIP